MVAFDKSGLDSFAGNPTLTRLCRLHRLVRLVKTHKWIVISVGLRVHSTWHVVGAHQACVRAKIKVLVAVDQNDRVCKACRANYGETKVVCSDIRNSSWLCGFVNHVIFDRLRIVIATPPCQPFSKFADQPGRSCLQGRLADAAFEAALVG